MSAIRRQSNLKREVAEAGHVRRHMREIQALESESLLSRRRFWRDWTWLILLLTALAAYGLAVFYGRRTTLGENAVDALRLFPSGFPGWDDEDRGPYRLARHLAALVGLFLTLRVLAAVFSDRLDRLRARRRSGHVIVCGLGEKGLRTVRAFRSAGRKVTCIDANPSADLAEDARARGVLVLQGDASQAVTLRAASLARADHLVALCPDDATNARIAEIGKNASDELFVYAHVRNPELARGLRRAGLAQLGARVHFFNIDHVWATAMLEHEDSPVGGASMGSVEALPTIVVLGGQALGQAVLLGAARRWHRMRASDEKIRIALVDPRAPATCERLARRYPALTRVSVLEAVEQNPLDLPMLDVTELAGDTGSIAVFVCLLDHSEGIALALQADHELARREARILTPGAAAAAEVEGLLPRTSRVRVVALPDGREALDLLHDAVRESLARSVHDAYLAGERGKPGFGTKPAHRPWEELPETPYREDNRDHADTIIRQLQAVWWEIGPRYDWDEPLVKFDAETVEVMAELEHERFCAARKRAGYRWGAVRDDVEKTHPLLVPWGSLDEEARDIDRDLVAHRPELLASLDYRPERSPLRDRLARLLHERYVGEQVTRIGTSPAMVPWEQLSEDYREANRANVDEIAAKLVRMGYRLAPARLEPTPRFSEEDVERLAPLEHERWRAERERAGWTPSSIRDDEAKVHPDLVPWEQLSPEAQEKDRTVVRAIPDLLAEIGLTFVRRA
jgi:hypothetical protein